MDNYEKSNSIEALPNLKLFPSTRTLFSYMREKSSIKQDDLQRVADAICNDLKVSKVNIVYGGTQNNTRVNGKLKSKTLGLYYSGSTNIKIFQYTAVKQKEVAPKTSLDVLLHELMHHFDYKILGLLQSIHSGGFYKRIGHLKAELLK
jgi:hypothetical protein